MISMCGPGVDALNEMDDPSRVILLVCCNMLDAKCTDCGLEFKQLIPGSVSYWPNGHFKAARYSLVDSVAYLDVKAGHLCCIGLCCDCADDRHAARE